MKKGGCRAIELDVGRPELPSTGSPAEDACYCERVDRKRRDVERRIRQRED